MTPVKREDKWMKKKKTIKEAKQKN